MSNGINTNGNPPDFDVWAREQGLDPMTMLPLKATRQKSVQPPPDMSEVLSTTPSQIEGEDLLYSLRKRGIDVYADSDLDELLEARAEKQGVGEVAANAAARFQVGLIGELASGLGGIADIPNDVASWFGAEREFGNALTQWGDEFKKTVDEDWFPIYRSQDRDFMDIGDWEWWLENGSSIARSAAGFIATGALVSGGLGAIGKGISGLSKAGKGATLLETLGMTPYGAARTASALGRGGNTLATAYMLNHAEGVMEATQVYNDAYNELLKRGYSEEEAKAQASMGAAATVNANRINILLNLTSAAKFLKPLGSARNLIEMPSFKKGLKSALFEGGQEFAEEEINLLASEYGRGIAMGEVPNYAKGFDKVFSMEGLETGFLGMLGGVAQTTAANIANKSKYNPLTRVKTDKGYISKYDFIKEQASKQQALLQKYEGMLSPEQVKKLTTAFNSNLESLQDIDEIQKAFDNNDEVKLRELQSRELGYQATEAFMSGTTEQFLETLQKATDNLVESTEDAALAKQYRESGQKAVSMVKNLETRFNNNEVLINRMNIEGDPEKVADFKNYMKFKVNSINTRSWLAQNSSESLEGMVASQDMAGGETSELEKFVSPYVKKQAAQLEGYKKEYLEWMNPKSAQQKFEKWSKEQAEIQEKVNDNENRETVTDNTIAALKDAITQAGYSQKVDDNIIDLPGVGRVRGVMVDYDGKTWRATKETDGTLNLVNVENPSEVVPFNRDFLKENASKLGIIPAERVQEDFRKRRDQKSKYSIIQNIKNILNQYDQKRETLNQEIQKYQEQVAQTKELLEKRKAALTQSIKDRTQIFEVLKDKEVTDLADTIQTGERIIEALEEQKAQLESAMISMEGLGQMYLSDFESPEIRFISPRELRNELQRLQGENLFEQKERDILDKSIDDIEKAIADTEKALEILTKEKNALSEAYGELSKIKNISDKEVALKYVELKQAIDVIKELESKLADYKKEFELKTTQPELQKQIELLNLHMNALRSRFKGFYEAPDIKEYEDAPQSDITDSQDPEKQAKTWETAKSNSVFYTTGANVAMDKKTGEDKYDADGKPVLVQNPLEKNWFEFLDLKEIPAGSKLMTVRYNPDPKTDKEKELNNIIEQRLYNPENPVVPSPEDVIVIMVTADSTGTENFKPVIYKDLPLVSVLPIPENLLPSWKGSKVNAKSLISMYASITGSTLEAIQSDKFVVVKDGTRTVVPLNDAIKQKLVDRIKEHMQNNLNALVSGDMLNIETVTNGHPVIYKEVIDGKLQTVNRPFIQVFPEYKMKDGKPENFTLEVIDYDNPNFGGKEFEIAKGSVVVVKDDSPQTLYTRKLNKAEVDSVLALLSLPKDASFPLGTYEKDGKKESNFLLIGGSRVERLNVFPQFSANPTDSDKVSLLTLLMNYGVKNRKSETLSNWDIFKTLNGKVVFKFKDTVYSINEGDVLNPDKNKELREFLAEKKVNINKFLIGKKGKYFHPKVTVDKGAVKVDYVSRNSYEDFIMNDAAVSYNYRTPEGQTLFQKNVVLQTDNAGNLVKNQTITTKQPKPVTKQQPVVSDIKIGDKVKVNTPQDGEGIIKEDRGDKVLLEDGRQVAKKNLTKLESALKPQAAPVSTDTNVERIEIPRYFTFGELGGAKGKSGKAMSSVEADRNQEIAENFEKQLKEGDKLIEPNGTITYFKNGKVVKANGSLYGMVDIPAFINGVTIERTKVVTTDAQVELPIQYQYNIPSRQDIKGKLNVPFEDKDKVGAIIDAFRSILSDVNAESIYSGLISEALSSSAKKLVDEYFKGGYNNWAGESQEHINKHNELSRKISKAVLDDYISFLQKYGWDKSLEKYTGEIPKELAALEETKPTVVTDETKTPIDIESKTKEELFPIDSLHKGKESGDTLKVIGYTKDGVRFQIQTEGTLKPTKNVILSELKRLIKEGKLTSDIYAELATLEQQPIVLGTISDEGFVEPFTETFESTAESEVAEATPDVSQEELDRAKAIALGEEAETPAAIQEAVNEEVSVFEENKSKAIENLKSMVFPNPRVAKGIIAKYKAAKTQEDLDDLAEEVRKICNS